MPTKSPDPPINDFPVMLTWSIEGLNSKSYLDPKKYVK